MRNRTTLAIVTLTLGSISVPRGVQAQAPPSSAPRVSIGATMPITRSTEIEITSGHVGVAAAFWAEATFYPSSKISIGFSTELPSSFEMQTRHGGSAAYTSTVDHHDFIFMPLVGFHLPPAERVRAVAQFGAGPTLASTVTVFGPFLPHSQPAASRPEVRQKVVPSLEGGIDVVFMLNDRANVVVRVHARNTWRHELFSDEVVGGFTLSPGVGLQFRL